MKILEIQIKNINSLAGMHTLSLADGPLGRAGIFAITGPMGAGKTTLLDAITLALFNRTPRISTISKIKIGEQGSIVTFGKTDAMASVVYECTKGTFQSTWSISQNRNNNWNEYHMEIKDVQTNNLMDLKKKDVPSQNEKLIGLDYGQFVKSLLLSQGEFAAFIKANKNEKYALLEKLTGGEIYRLIGSKVFEKAREAEQALKQIQEQLQNERWQAIGDLETLMEQKETLEAEKPELQQRVEQLRKDLEASNMLNQQWENRANEEITHTRLKGEQEDMNRQRPEIERHEKALQFKGSIDAFAKQRRSFESEKNKTDHKKEALENLEKDIAQLHLKANQLLSAVIAKDELDTKLEDLERRFSLSQKEVLSANQAKDEAKNSMEGNKKLLHHQHQTEPFSTLQLAQWLEKIKEQKAKMPFQSIEEAEEEINNLEKREKVLNEWKDALVDYTRIEQELGRWQQDLQDYRKKLGEIIPQEKEVGKEVQVCNDLLEAQEKIVKQQTLIKDFEEKRHDLVNGEPCPLCGAMEHPWAAGIEAKPDAEEARLTDLRGEHQLLSKVHQALINRIHFFNGHSEQAQGEINMLQPRADELKKSLQQYAQMGLGEDPYKALQENKKAVAACKEWKVWFQRGENYQLFKGFVSNFEVKQKVWKEKSEEFNKEFGALNLDAIRQTRTQWKALLDQFKAQSTEFKTLRAFLQTLEEELEKAASSLETAVLGAGFASVQEAQNSLMDIHEVAAWKERRSALSEELTASKTRKEELEKSINALQKQGYKRENLEDLASSKEVEEERLQHTLSALGSLNEKINQALALKDEKETLTKECNQKEAVWREWATLKELIGDATGNKFSNLAQVTTLKMLVYLANQRLKELNPRYQIKPDKDELYVVDLHMANHERSVQTLSGGEIFLLSLAMALALSDLAAQKIPIKTMFIDEGFGSLDAETLDLAMSTLETLQASSQKTLGIISHVEALKERFATKIVIQKRASGFSSLRIEEASGAFV